MGFLIDTSVFITMERRGKGFADLVPTVGEEGVAVATISISELYEGVLRADTESRSSARLRFVVGLVEHTPIARFELSDAIVHANLKTILRRKGTPIGAHDLIIAAIASSRGLAVVTENLDDFQKIPGLSVIRPVW